MTRNKEINEQMRAESRRKILATASHLFAERGFFTVTIAEISRAAGMSPGNIYWYFDSKEAVLKSLLQSLFDGMEQILIEAKDLPGSGLDKINRLIDRMLEFIETGGDFFQIYLSMLGHGGQELFAALGFDTVATGQRYHEHLASILAQAMAEGSLPPADSGALGVFFFSLFNGMLVTYGRNWKMVPPDTIRTAALRVLGYTGSQ